MVYFTSKYVFKIFSSDPKIPGVLACYEQAEVAGIPIPCTKGFYNEYLILDDPRKIDKVSGIRMNRIPQPQYTFFKLSVSDANLRIAIEKIPKNFLVRIISALENAGEFGLADPQGFFSTNQDPPLVFIDIHSGGTKNPKNITDLIEVAEKRLGQL